MKKRLVKKWISRYINPLLRGLPITEYHSQIIDLKNGMKLHVGNQHIIVNGYLTKEGQRYKTDSNVLSSIKRTREYIKVLKTKYAYVFVRIKPMVREGQLYIRLTTEDIK